MFRCAGAFDAADAGAGTRKLAVAARKARNYNTDDARGVACKIIYMNDGGFRAVRGYYCSIILGR